jgi:hypothetical protein
LGFATAAGLPAARLTGLALRLPQDTTLPPRPIRERFHASCSLILPIFFQGYNQDAVWRAISEEKLCLNRQKDPL